jgi:NADH-quinone oxidoreductase subunit L
MGVNLAWMIPLFPLLAALLLIGGRKSWKRDVAAMIGIVATCISFLLSGYVCWGNWGSSLSPAWKIPWFQLDQKMISISIQLESLHLLMLLIVSLVSFLVHIYSWGYMKRDERFNTFYAYLALFTFSMLGLVISANLLQLYFFWELVGVCSFLLIGFWYHKPAAKAAAQKAFIVTRISDVGLFISIILIFWQVGSFEINDLFQAITQSQIDADVVTWIAILAFIGAMGKSGQFLLHIWLPDAMEGPTPVSALIHAATMVAAGVYLVADLFFLFQASTVAMSMVAYIGGITAIFAATIALVQHDIKRVLAYSTVSQLGYMMMALGCGGYVAGLFHLMTHAFFKALLFLAAGAVIVSLQHEQDIRNMGGLFRRQRWLGICFCIGCLSMVGIPPFSGFFSKEEMLTAIYADGRIGLFLLSILTTFLTAIYIFRLFFMVFAGEVRGQSKVDAVPKVMKGSIAVLAVLSTISGFFNSPYHRLEYGLIHGTQMKITTIVQASIWLSLLAIFVSLLGISLAYLMYGKQGLAPASVVRAMPWAYRLLYRAYYINELYQLLFVWPLKGIGWFLNGWDRFVVGGLVHFSAWVVLCIGRLGSRLQNGQVQTYVLVSLIGMILLMVGLTAGRFFL